MKRWLIMLWLSLLAVGAMFGEFIAPYDVRTQHRPFIGLPPMPIRFIDEHGRFHLRPFVYAVQRDLSVPGRHYTENRQERYPLAFFVRGDSYKLLGVFEGSLHLFGLQVPNQQQVTANTLQPTTTRVHLLGTDRLGRDVFSRLVYGCRVTLSIALSSLVVALVLGVSIGGVSGYFGGRVDAVLMRLGELVQSIPAIFLILALRAAFPLDISYAQTLAILIAIFALVSWPEVSRLVRSNVLTLMSREFVVSAKAVGAPDSWVIRHHILPNALTPALVQATIIVPSFILGEAALSFLGVGIQEPQPSWGNMLSAARELPVLLNDWWILMPGVAILVTVLTFNALGDAVRDWLDPRSRTRPSEWG
ncbi:MAG: ABC transporter permease [Acidobacteriota bacterium]|nr:ABC transporter permease [Blastocatellia bacterium]MDW8240698.1 ABC transporter permease [Acidobacteriota bacterium]